MEAIFSIILIELVRIGIVLELGVLCCGAVGAMHQFAWASEFGFIGVIIFLQLGFSCFRLWRFGRLYGAYWR